MKKIIGITASRRKPTKDGVHSLNMKYTDMLLECNMVPIIVPVGADVDIVSEMLDGLILSGGTDIHPLFYDRNVTHSLNPDMERDEYEIVLYKKMKELEKPILGICRGFQLILVAEGYQLAQDLFEDTPSTINHTQGIDRIYPSHFVAFKIADQKWDVGSKLKTRIADMSKLGEDDLVDIFGEVCMTNSLHHQGIHLRQFRSQHHNNENVVVTAVADDLVIEAIKVKDTNVIAVQFHPEEAKDLKLIKRCFE